MRSIETCFPENNARTELEKVAVSCGLASAWTRKMQCRGTRSLAVAEMAKSATIRLAKMDFMTD